MNNTRFTEYLARKRREYGDKFDPSDLAPQFIDYFNNGARIEVDMGYEVKRGRIGVTMGWKPAFLLMLTTRSIGSPYILERTHKITRVIRYN